jgi:ADP-ribose pyrophosphatase
VGADDVGAVRIRAAADAAARCRFTTTVARASVGVVKVGGSLDLVALQKRLASTREPVRLTAAEQEAIKAVVHGNVDMIGGALTPEARNVLREFLAQHTATQNVRGVKLGDGKHAPIASEKPLHVKSRTEKPDSYPARAPVPDDKVAFATPHPDYKPAYHVDATVLKRPVWADPEDITQVTRAFKSNAGTITFNDKGHPQNPMGRTGIEGRGLLGAWGANQAGDPILTKVNPDTGKLELLVIQRKDSGQWALPGGMVDEGENIFKTIARELEEETTVKLDFSDAKHVYQGYVDDRRNTDNAWMETTVKHKHLTGKLAAQVNPQAGDEADARFIPLTKADVESLYASHGSFVKQALREMVKDKSLDASVRAQIRSILVEG